MMLNNGTKEVDCKAIKEILAGNDLRKQLEVVELYCSKCDDMECKRELGKLLDPTKKGDDGHEGR